MEKSNVEKMLEDISPEIRSKMIRVLKALHENKKKILLHGTTGDATFIIGDHLIVLK